MAMSGAVELKPLPKPEAKPKPTEGSSEGRLANWLRQRRERKSAEAALKDLEKGKAGEDNQDFEQKKDSARRWIKMPGADRRFRAKNAGLVKEQYNQITDDIQKSHPDQALSADEINTARKQSLENAREIVREQKGQREREKAQLTQEALNSDFFKARLSQRLREEGMNRKLSRFDEEIISEQVLGEAQRKIVSDRRAEKETQETERARVANEQQRITQTEEYKTKFDELFDKKFAEAGRVSPQDLVDIQKQAIESVRQVQETSSTELLVRARQSPTYAEKLKELIGRKPHTEEELAQFEDQALAFAKQKLQAEEKVDSGLKAGTSGQKEEGGLTLDEQKRLAELEGKRITELSKDEGEEYDRLRHKRDAQVFKETNSENKSEDLNQLAKELAGEKDPQKRGNLLLKFLNSALAGGAIAVGGLEGING